MKWCTVSFLSLLSVSAWANDIYVDGTWGGPFNGTEAQPYGTIATGYAALTSLVGSHLYIAPATYAESALIVAKHGESLANPLVFQPWPGKTGLIVLDGTLTVTYFADLTGRYIMVTNSPTAAFLCKNYTQNGFYVEGSSNVIYGVIFTTNSLTSGVGGNAISTYGHALTVDSCTFTNNYRTAIKATSVTNCVFRNNFITNLMATASGQIIYGIQLSAPTNCVVSNNFISVLDQGSGKQGTGIHISQGTNSTIVANFLSGNSIPFARNTFSGILAYDTTNTVISCNTVTNWGWYGIDVGGSAGKQCQGTLIERNHVANCGHGNVAIDGDTVGTTIPIICQNNISILDVEPPGAANYNGGFDFHSDTKSTTAVVKWYNNTHFTAPTVTSAYAAGFWTDYYQGTGTYVLINNIFCVAAGDAFKWQTNLTYATLTLSNNLFYAVTGKAVRYNFGADVVTYANDHVLGGSAGYFSNDVGLTGLLNGTDPLFVAAPGNLRLTSSSPAVGTGVNLLSIFTNDFSNDSRGTVWDIGAYAYVVVRQVVAGSSTIEGNVSIK